MDKFRTLILATVLLFMSSCATPQRDADVPLLRYEQGLETLLPAMDTVLAWEFTNRDTAPKEVVKAAAKMRTKAAKAFASGDAIRIAYRKGAADADALRRATYVIDGLLAEARKWWVPANNSGAPASASALSQTIAEAEASRSGAPASWITTATLLIDLGTKVYRVVNKAQDAGRRDRQWTEEESVAFTAQLTQVINQPHWKENTN